MDCVDVARLFYQLFNERRIDESSELVDPKAEFHYVPTRQRLLGRAGHRALVATWLNAFPDARLEITALRKIDDETLDVEFLGHGTHTGELVLGDAVSVPATGKSAHLPFRDRLRIRDGVIVGSELSFDVNELKRILLGPAR